MTVLRMVFAFDSLNLALRESKTVGCRMEIIEALFYSIKRTVEQILLGST